MLPDATQDVLWWTDALRGWAVMLVLAGIYWPVTRRVFRGLPDRGAAFAIPGGWFCAFLVMQIAWRLGLSGPTPGASWLWVGCTGGAAWFLSRTSLRPSFGTRARIRGAAARHVMVFSLLFAFWALLRSTDPGISHTEQPMDAMWLRAAMETPVPPVADAWAGGKPATYYVDGHLGLAMFARLTGHPMPIATNTGQIMLFALTGSLAFAAAGKMAYRSASRFSSGAGMLAVMLVLFTSTLTGAWQAVTTEGEHWWWWKASRALQDASGELITEFPFFSFWLGDNHAHVLGLPVLLLSIPAALQVSRVRTLTPSTLAVCSLSVVWSWRINPWQTPTVLAILGVGLLLRKKRPSPSEVSRALWGGVLPLLLIFPMRPPGLETGIIVEPAPWLFPYALWRVFGAMLPGIVLMLFLRGRLLPKALVLLGLAMLLAPEFIRVQDAFGTRMNTVFKVYYQIWILWALAAAVGWREMLRKAGALRPLILLTLILPVFGWTYAARLSGSALAKTPRSLDARSALSDDQQNLILMADRLIRPGERIAEAPGIAYRADTSLLGTWTAGNTLVGWEGHQMQWRTRYAPPSLSPLYEAPSSFDLRQALDTLDVDWVLLGPNERARYAIHQSLDAWLLDHANRVVHTPTYSLYRVQP